MNTETNSIRVEIAGENALIIYFGDKTDPRVSSQVQQAVTILETELNGKLIDMVPSYASLLVIYDQLATDHLEVRRCIRELLSKLDNSESSEGNLVILPAYYSTESGPDLEALAQRADLSIEEVIKIHSEMEYRVYAIGFAPGFAYLGEVDARIAAPRLATPRTKVPRGAIAIADRQTAVYPAVSPGGWNLIGLCPTRMFDPKAEPTMPVQVGDRVRFNPISREEFFAQGGELGEIR
ncbi:sensor histidine kinase inhibitor, KipI family [Amphritea atlantica]|uniref:Sensor histidine kinase inhibitor, KipI family n=1 Tax=Amphritea atlantica TaxID=355243 RepID=A0A1H9DG12_9GAMM|nr:5-oxoprolinase subunit PxpB [Amphritea atlantica]SEQ11668.1 sensor histidine kinase inhibitor, KipI family [Amphritea atlantica]